MKAALNKLDYQIPDKNKRAGLRRIRLGFPPSPQRRHAPTPTQPPKYNIHTGEFSTPRLSSFGKKETNIQDECNRNRNI